MYRNSQANIVECLPKSEGLNKPMTETSNSIQKSMRWKTFAPYIALFCVTLILLFVIFNKQENPENSENTSSPERSFEATGTSMQPATQGIATVTTNGTPVSAVSAPADPFKAFLEAHKNDPIPQVNNQPKPQTQQEIKDIFKAAVEKDISAAYPFAVSHTPKSIDRNN